MKPLVSIVLPTYNGGKYIKESIDSILAQTYTNWELIAVDDSSTDGTLEVLKQYESLDDRIIVIHNVINQKLPASLNIGFAKAQGKYLTWTSDDNRYLPYALETMVRYLEEHSDAIVVRSNYYFIDMEGTRIGQSQEYSDYKMYRQNCFGACFLYRREVLEQVGEYDTDTFGVEDYDYWLRILDKFGKIDSIDEKLYEYRRHNESLSETKRQMVLKELVRLRRRYQKKIFSVYREDRAWLCEIYYEMLPLEFFYGEFKNCFYDAVPELKRDKRYICRKQFIILGAGIYGERAEKLLGDKAVYFADNDLKKAGQLKCGKKILSFKEARTLALQYDFMIAVSEIYIYELIKQLEQAGIFEYTTLQSYMLGSKEGENYEVLCE